MTAQPNPIHNPLPGVEVRVMVPRPGLNFQNVPWMNIVSGIMSINPDTTRETSAILRAIAQEIDEGWAILDRAAELAGQPEDTTQFSALDNLAAGLPAFAPRVED